MDSPIIILHQSDIHFRHDSPEADHADVQRELLRDVERLRQDGFLPHIERVLISGDIAYSGKKSEYDEAAQWLDTLCDKAGCHAESVRVIPGNHDVDRDTADASGFTELLHKEIRPDLKVDAPQQITQHINTRLHKYLSGKEGDVLFEPLAAYNAFALRYGCTTTREHVRWRDDISMNDGSTLRIWGINSAIISCRDNKTDRKLVVGTRQSLLDNEIGVTHLTMCHHPPTWLCDEDEVDMNLNLRSRVQLFGHRHRQRLSRVDDALRLSAGAVGPSRDEADWQPRYNVIMLFVAGVGSNRTLQVQIWPRIYHSERREFVADFDPSNGNHHREFHLPLSAWHVETPVVHMGTVAAKPNAQSPSEPSDKSVTPGGRPRLETGEEPTMNAERQLLYRFFRLGYTEVTSIAAKLGLLSDEDQNVPDTERFQRYFRRAKERGRFEELWDEVAHRSASTEENPFRLIKGTHA